MPASTPIKQKFAKIFKLKRTEHLTMKLQSFRLTYIQWIFDCFLKWVFYKILDHTLKVVKAKIVLSGTVNFQCNADKVAMKIVGYGTSVSTRHPFYSRFLAIMIIFFPFPYVCFTKAYRWLFLMLLTNSIIRKNANTELKFPLRSNEKPYYKLKAV
jgi:hypothetical protein